MTNTGVCVGLSCGVGTGAGGSTISGAWSGMVVSGVLVVSVPVRMIVGGVKSGVVGVSVAMLEGSGSGVGVIVVVGNVSLVALEVADGAIEVKGGGDGVSEAVGEGVCVRQGPCVLLGL